MCELLHPFSITTTQALRVVQGWGRLLKPIAVVFGLRRGYHRVTSADKQPLSTTQPLTANSEFTFRLHACWTVGRSFTQTRGEHANSSEKGLQAQHPTCNRPAARCEPLHHCVTLNSSPEASGASTSVRGRTQQV